MKSTELNITEWWVAKPERRREFKGRDRGKERGEGERRKEGRREEGEEG